MVQVFDVIVVGAGPAGLSAAIACARQRLSTLVLARELGGQVNLIGEVRNFLGSPVVTGSELVSRFKGNLGEYRDDLTFKAGVRVLGMGKGGGEFQLQSSEGEFEGRSVILATGRRPKKLRIPGEAEYFGRGVSDCAACDAALFSGKPVAVVGGGTPALDAALQLVGPAGKVFIVTENASLHGEARLLKRVQANPKIELFTRSTPTEIVGGKEVRGVRLKFVSGLKIEQKGVARTLDVAGVFIEAGYEPDADYADLLERNEEGEIVVDGRNQSSMAGVFAAGDVTTVPVKGVMVAAGEGLKAAASAIAYLAKQDAAGKNQ